MVTDRWSCNRRVKTLRGWWNKYFKLAKAFKVLDIKRINTPYSVFEHRGSKLRIEDVRLADAILTRESNPTDDNTRRNRQ